MLTIAGIAAAILILGGVVLLVMILAVPGHAVEFALLGVGAILVGLVIAYLAGTIRQRTLGMSDEELDRYLHG